MFQSMYMNKGRLSAIVTLAAILVLYVLPKASLADQQTQTGANKYWLEEIVVTARKRSESIFDVPESITAFSAVQIDAMGIKNMDDFTKLTPSVHYTQGAGPGEPSINIRGMGQAQGAEQSVAVVIDGVQLSHPIFMAQDFGDVERIEVLRGPQGSLYGRNAIGGAINIVTKQPGDEFDGRIKASYGNADRVTVRGNFSGPIVKDKAYFRISGSHDTTDGQIKNTFLDTYADNFEETYLRAFLGVQLASNINLDLRANYGDNSGGSLTAEAVPTAIFDDFDPGFLQRSVDTQFEREIYDFSAKLDIEFETMTFTSITDYGDAKTDLEGDADFSPAPAVLQDVDVHVEAFTQEVRLASNSDGPLTWLIGAFYQDRDTENLLRIPLDDGTGNPLPVLLIDSADNGTSKAWAVFGSATWSVTDNIDLTFGLRHDEDKRTSVDANIPGSDAARTFSSTQPKVQVSYKINPDLNIYATYGRGFRSGGFNAFASIGVDRAYEAEFVDNIEVGMKGTLADGKLSFSASIFRNYYDNQQFFFVNLNPPSQNVINIEETVITGGELEVSYRPLDNLLFSAGLGIVDPEIKENLAEPLTRGNFSPQTTKYTLNLSGQYIIPVSDTTDVRMFAGYRRNGKKYWDAANSLSTPGKDFVDLRLFLERDKWSIGAFVKNLLDEQYPNAAGANVFGPGVHIRIPSFRRTYGVEASYSF